VSGIVAGLFLLMAAILLVYDAMVTNRSRKLIGAANNSTALVDSLYPPDVVEQLLAEQEKKAEHFRQGISFFRYEGTQINDCANDGPIYSPIAALFPETSILSADIVGFTSWSSIREPSQVFQLLEALYGAYDKIAHRRHVFKIETVGGKQYIAAARRKIPCLCSNSF
jgi:hypothetical protein